MEIKSLKLILSGCKLIKKGFDLLKSQTLFLYLTLNDIQILAFYVVNELIK
ncbi:hypothetical protein IWX80_002299 [Flavobacterium sp. CAN_S2]